MNVELVRHRATIDLNADAARPARGLGIIPSCALVCEGLLDRLPVALLLVDEHGTVRSANDFAVRLLRRERAALEGAPIARYLCPLEELTATIGRGECRMTVHGPDGALLELACATAQIAATPGEGPGPYAVIVRAATTLESDDLHRLAVMGAAVPAMVHRVKNSLMAVTMGLELLPLAVSAAEVEHHRRLALGEAQDAGMALDRFGAMGRPLRCAKPADPTAMLEDTRLRAGERADRAHLKFEWLVDRLPPLCLDPTVVHALLINLICHAFAECDPGDTLRVEARLQGRGLEIVIVDACSPNARAITSTDLTLCRKILEVAGGSLDQSEGAAGERVRTITIPEAAPPRPRNASAPEAS